MVQIVYVRKASTYTIISLVVSVLFVIYLAFVGIAFWQSTHGGISTNFVNILFWVTIIMAIITIGMMIYAIIHLTTYKLPTVVEDTTSVSTVTTTSNEFSPPVCQPMVMQSMQQMPQQQMTTQQMQMQQCMEQPYIAMPPPQSQCQPQVQQYYNTPTMTGGYSDYTRRQTNSYTSLL